MKGANQIKVNTLIIGAGRSGTTSIYSFIKDHKQVCFSSVKEVHFFSIPDLYKRGEKYYHSFFKEYKDQPVVASADTYLLMDYEAIKRIYNYNPRIKIIVILRDPVERAFSSYNYSVNYGHHKAYSGLLESIHKEKDIVDEADIVKRNNKGHFYGGLYHQHLSQWADVFGKENILILTTQNLKTTPNELADKLCRFLAIPTDSSGFTKENAAAVPRFKRFEQFLLNRDLWVRKLIRRAIPGFIKRFIIHSGVVDKMHDANRKPTDAYQLSKDEKEKAYEFFSEDLLKLKRDFCIDFQ